MWDFLIAQYRFYKKSKANKKLSLQKATIAQTFNNLYTYQQQYVEGRPYLEGTYYGVPHRSGYAWMCPDCNKIHHPFEDSVFSGLQYPACCTTGIGHRLDVGIKLS